jgi:hypothetical protein
MRFRRLLAVLALVCLATPLALAQTTGSVSGVVRNPEGAGLPGVTVTISGEKLPLGRTTHTLSDGAFQFIGLIPGEYRLKAELPGLGVFEQNVVVALSEETEVRPVLRATATAAVEVSAALPLVDTKASDISHVTKSEEIRKLPIGGSFAATFALAAGVPENTTTAVSAPNAGGGRQDNTFLYDGVNVTNPFFGDLFQDFTGFDIQEVNITRGGVPAEAGRTGGFLVNAVTKSGSNSFHGGVSVEYQPIEWTADSTDPTLQRSKFERFRPGVNIAGPIWRDHLFFYGSGNFYRVSEKERVNQFGSSPGNPVENDLPDADTNTDEYFGKLTANPTSSVLIDGSYRYRKIESDNTGIGTRAQASTAENGKTEDRVGVVTGLWSITPTWTLEAKYNHNEDNNSIEPVTPLGYQPAFNPTAPYLVGQFTTSITGGVDFIYPPAHDVSQVLGGSVLAVNDQDFIRDEYRLQTTYLANFIGATHDIRLGATYSENEEDLLRVGNGWGSIIATTSSNCGPASARPCFRARYSPRQDPQVSKAETWGIFLQDQMTWNRLTLNLGVLANRDEFIPQGGNFVIVRGDFTLPNGDIPTCDAAPQGAPACTYLDTVTFDFEDQIQPRVGLAFEANTRVHDKFYANYARYSNMDNQSFARSAAPIRLFRRDAYFDRTTGALITEIVRSNQVAKRVLEHIDPTKTDEVIAGYARPLGAGWAAELWGMYRYADDIIEDFPGFNRNDAGNLGNFRYGNIAGHRKYRAATIEVRRAYRDRWTLDVSYTLSKLEGNWDLDGTGVAVFYTSSYIDDGPGLYTTDPFRNGTLAGDRKHVGKVFASYEFPTNTTAGVYFRYQSGRPWEARGFDPANGVALLYLEPAGSRRLESWTNVDLQITQKIPLRPVEIIAGVRIGNVFNEQPALSVDQVKFSDLDNTVLNPNFGKPTAYAAPRRFTLVAGVTF